MVADKAHGHTAVVGQHGPYESVSPEFGDNFLHRIWTDEMEVPPAGAFFDGFFDEFCDPLDPYAAKPPWLVNFAFLIYGLHAQKNLRMFRKPLDLGKNYRAQSVLESVVD